MPRTPRHWRPHHGQHMISRFIDRRFHLESSRDRAAYLDIVALAHKRWDWKWLSYALMSSHVHDGLIAGEDSPQTFYGSAHTRYARYYKDRNHSLGPVYSGRPDNWEVRPVKLARMVAYHHRNPVEAGVVAHAAQSTWTSHRAYLRLEPSPSFLDIEFAYQILGFDDTPGGRRSFDEFVFDFDFAAHHESLQTGTEFCMQAGNPTRLHLSHKTCTELLRVVAEVCSVDVAALRFGRSRNVCQARRVFTHVMTVHLASTVTDAARVLGQGRTALVNLMSRCSGPSMARVRIQAELVMAGLSPELLALSEV